MKKNYYFYNKTCENKVNQYYMIAQKDIFMFSIICFVFLYSCRLLVIRYIKDMINIRNLNMQIVPAVEIKETEILPRVPELPSNNI